MKYVKVITLSLLLVPLLGNAQKKIKYKDLFPILNSKNYTEGEPQLKTFLSDIKNEDHANAHYHMGLILEKRFLEKDIWEILLLLPMLGIRPFKCSIRRSD